METRRIRNDKELRSTVEDSPSEISAGLTRTSTPATRTRKEVRVALILFLINSGTESGHADSDETRRITGTA